MIACIHFFLLYKGSLDILVLQDKANKDAERIPNFIINNFFNDAFFLKGLGKLVFLFVKEACF
jgi:integrin alpha FG-GAP repeat containing protein 1